MKQTWIGRGGAGFLVVLLGLAGPALAQKAEGEAPAVGPSVVETVGERAPWLRIAEEREGQVLKLQAAVRQFVHEEADRPRITIAGAVHVGERAFYERLQEILDAQDVVLYEGVRVGRGESQDVDDARVMLTRSRMRILASMLDAYRREHGHYPEDLAGLLEVWPDAALAKQPTDAWGNTLVYFPENGEEPRFEIVSLGADGREGGEGAAAEIRMSSMGEARAPGRRPEGIQKQMAEAMGLVFQPEVMDHSSPRHRNSDMAMEDLRERFAASGVDAEGLFGMLDGSSLMGRFSGLLLGMMGSSEESRGLLKAVMIEVLSNAELLMEQLPGQAGAMMAVIVDERNEVVLADVARLIETEPHVRMLGIIYGAGHLAHMERRLVEDFGYVATEDSWLTVIEVDAEEAGIPPARLRMMRQMIQRSLERQMQQRQPR